MSSDDVLTALARVLAPIVAREVVRELRSGASDMIDQGASPLGARRHAAAARRRRANGEGGAAHVGRRWLLTREAIQAELAKPAKMRGPRKPRPAAANDVDDLADLRARYGVRKVGT
jgi:hypothetical protein